MAERKFPFSGFFRQTGIEKGAARKYHFSGKKKQVPGKEWLPLVTLYLFSITLFIYYLSVSFFPFISPSYDILSKFGLHLNAPWSVITYMFVHLWPSHLLVDCLLLLIFGTIVERRIGGVKMLSIFIVSGILGGLVNLFFFPTKILIGSSGGGFGLIGAAVVLSPKISLALFVLSLNLFAPIVVKIVDSVETSFVERIFEQKAALKTVDSILLEKLTSISDIRASLNRTISEKKSRISELESILLSIEKKRASGELSESEHSSQSSQILSEISEINGKIAEDSRNLTILSRDFIEVGEERRAIVMERHEIDRKEHQLSVTERTKAGTPEAPFPHAVGIFFGGLIVFLLEKSVFLDWEERYLWIKSRFVRKKTASRK